MTPPHARTPHYERLSPQDSSFLSFEYRNVQMHVCAVAVFAADSFALASGEIDVAKFRRFIESRLDVVPRTRQRLAKIPLFRQPVWVDDNRFDIGAHVRELKLNAPGGEAELQTAVSEILSERLDRSRPLWEMHVVQGLAEPGTFAVIAKAHHAMLDGIAGIEFTRIMLSPEPTDGIAPPRRYEPLPAPSSGRMLRDEALRYVTSPMAALRGLARLVRDGAARRALYNHARALTVFMASGLRGTPRNPLNDRTDERHIGGWFTKDSSAERLIRTRLGGTRDDVVLATATGAVRELLRRHHVDLARRVRAMLPFNLRSREDSGRLGNRVATLIVDLPADAGSPHSRLERVSERTARLVESKHQLAVDALVAIDRWTGTLAQSMAMWLSRRVRAYNLVVTHIPGPPVPLYALRSRLLAFYPFAPVFPDQHFNIAALPYMGKLHWGVHYAGHDPAEQARFMRDLSAAFDELAAAAANAEPRVRLVEPEAQDAAGDAARRAAAAL